MAGAEDAARAEVGPQLLAGITQIVRWAGRPDVRRRLLGPAGRDLSAGDVNLLRTIVATGPVRVTALADWQGVDKSTMTQQVRRLEQRGLVARQPDPDDGRAVLVVATAQGRRVRQRMDAAGAAVVNEMLQDWTEADRDALAELLTRFTDQLARQPAGHAEPADDPPGT